MNYEPDCADCPTPTICQQKSDCQVMRFLRHGHEESGGSGFDNVKNMPAELLNFPKAPK